MGISIAMFTSPIWTFLNASITSTFSLEGFFKFPISFCYLFLLGDPHEPFLPSVELCKIYSMPSAQLNNVGCCKLFNTNSFLLLNRKFPIHMHLLFRAKCVENLLNLFGLLSYTFKSIFSLF